MKANSPGRPSLHLLSLNLISKHKDMLLWVTGDIDYISTLTGWGVARMNNFMFTGSWGLLLKSLSILSEWNNVKWGSFGLFSFAKLSLVYIFYFF